jgi:hypothetical protein
MKWIADMVTLRVGARDSVGGGTTTICIPGATCSSSATGSTGIATVAAGRIAAGVAIYDGIATVAAIAGVPSASITASSTECGVGVEEVSASRRHAAGSTGAA